MRLLSLRLHNFRQHADTRIEFRPGLTGIIGPNGAGKSTLLEAIAWALYGAAAARGTNDTLRFARAAPRSRVEVELAFELGGHEYRVVRTMHNAEVFLDGGLAPVAATLGGATTYLQGRLGMSREEFFNTYFTGQKELQFLAAMGPTERGRFLSQVLGYERLRRAQDDVRTRRNEMRHEIRGLRAILGDPDALRAERETAEARVAELAEELAEAESALLSQTAALAEITPRWEAAGAARERDRELAHALDVAERERDAARRAMATAEAEIARIAVAEADLERLRVEILPLPALAAECERLSELARHAERRRALTGQLAEMDAELVRSAERLKQVESAPELERRYAGELAALREERTGADATREERNTAWLRDKQDADTKLQQFRERGRELKEQLNQLREMGPEGICPTCGRPVGADFERLHEELAEQWAKVVQDGKWWASRYEQLRQKPDELIKLEERLARLAGEIDDRTKKLAKCERAVQELATLREERGTRTRRRDELRRELTAIPDGYDAEHHRASSARLVNLRDTQTRAVRLEESVGRRVEREAERDAGRRQEAEALRRVGELTAERAALGFREAEFAELREAHRQAAEHQHRAELRVTELRGTLAAAEAAAVATRRAEAEYRERARDVEAREIEVRYHDELDQALSALRAELNAGLRPELSEIASMFLAQLTDGRYTAMEIDDGYNILVLDEGEEKPVISGGEEDVANLVLRLSLSQMIAERAGHPLSLLILDEVFGSLDVARRDNVVQLLHHLEDRFDQVILITHVEGIRESLDQVLRVEFDERNGTSTVREEGVPTESPFETDVAAD